MRRALGRRIRVVDVAAVALAAIASVVACGPDDSVEPAFVASFGSADPCDAPPAHDAADAVRAHARTTRATRFFMATSRGSVVEALSPAAA